MEFNEKLQELRKNRNLTQEQLAEQLYVSRTAISKWESGRGYPSIDSLKEIAKYFAISLDDLLSNEEILTMAQADNKRQIDHIQDIVFGLLDCSIASFLFIPFFSHKEGDLIEAIPLLALKEAPSYIIIPYYIIVFGLILCGIMTLALQNCTAIAWLKMKGRISLGISAIGALFFIVSLEPYAGMFTFLFLVIKALMLIKWA